MRCLNCDNEIKNPFKFCPNCGQQNRISSLRLKEFLAEVVDEVFSFDNRVFRTLKSILTKPGEITIDYLEGKRIKFIPPVRLYLVMSILLVFSIDDSENPRVTFSSYVSSSSTNDEVEYRSINILFRTVELDSKIFAKLNKISNKRLDSILIKQGVYPDPILKTYIRRIQSLDNEKGWVRIQSLDKNIKSSCLISLMPILAFFLMILFRRRYKFYVQHLIQSIHLNSVGFFLIIIGNKFQQILLPVILPEGHISNSSNEFGLFGVVLLLVFSADIPLLIYSLFCLRNTYRESMTSTTLKLLMVAVLYGFCFDIFLDFIKVGYVFFEV